MVTFRAWDFGFKPWQNSVYLGPPKRSADRKFSIRYFFCYVLFSIFMFPYFPFPILFRPILLLISTIILLSFFLALSPLLERLVFRVENWDSVPELSPEVDHARAGLHGAEHGLAVLKMSANGVPVPQV